MPTVSPRCRPRSSRLTSCMSAVLALSIPAIITCADAADPLQERAQRLFPKAKIESVRPTPIPNLHEIRMGQSLVYMDATGQYVLIGELYDFTRHQNLTAQRLAELTAVDYAQLPFQHAIRLGPSDATRRLAVFTDVDCPYCKKFHVDVVPRLIAQRVGVDIFLLPLASLHPRAVEKSQQIWCQPDRIAALETTMRSAATPGEPRETACVTPIPAIAALAQTLKIRGTPTIVLDTGVRIDGFLPYDTLMARWQAPSTPQP